MLRNHLAEETSPYLLQHAENPVDWYPWGEAALTRAKQENKPILLSIGYSACHWCHVMAHESFEDRSTAELMNELKGYENHKAPGRYFVTAEMGLQGRLQVGREPHQSEESLKSARIEGRILTSSRQKHILTGQLFWNMEVRGCCHGLDCKAPNDSRQERCIDR